MRAEPGYTHKVLRDGTIRVLYDTGDVLYSPPVPRWPWEVVHNYGQVVVGDQYRARQFVRPGMYVLDVGASFGTFTLLACKLGAKPVAIEPIHENVKCLELLRSTQGYEFEIVETAAGHYRGTAVISCSLDSISGGSFIVEGAVADDAKLIEIPIDTIDSVVAGLGLPRVDFVKADVEGYEHQMLRGAAHTLNEFHPALAVSAYHQPTDSATLPELLRALAPGYTNIEVLSVGPELELEMFARP